MKVVMLFAATVSAKSTAWAFNPLYASVKDESVSGQPRDPQVIA
jgi:hypothetical protein